MELTYNYKVKKISILVANNCFGQCEGCYLDKRDGKQLTANQIIEFGKILKGLGYEEITLSGGDPLVREDIFDIISGLHSLGFSLHLDTIGKPLLNKKFTNRFPVDKTSQMIKLIGLPFDGSNQQLFERFRTNSKTIMTDTLDILELLDRHNYQIAINTVVHKGNIDDLQSIYEIISKFPNVKRWELHQFAPLSKGSKQIANNYCITASEFEQAITKIGNKKNIEISPKPNCKKFNFKYLDFNGDLVTVKGGIKRRLINIEGLSKTEVTSVLNSL